MTRDSLGRIQLLPLGRYLSLTVSENAELQLRPFGWVLLEEDPTGRTRLTSGEYSKELR